MQETMEVRSTDFELERARNAYIPILECCYALAQGGEPEFPPGYVEVARIEADARMFSELMSTDFSAEGHSEVMAMASEVSNPERFGFVLRENVSGSFLVALRGTLVAMEWLRNFTAIPQPYDHIRGFGLVHLGFEIVYRQLRDGIIEGLRQVDAHTRITFVGHSLGGALCTLAAPDLKRNFGKRFVDVCTFGAPRVGKLDYRANFNATIPKCYRITNQWDIVPHVPPILTFWRHVGEEIGVDGNVDNPHSLDAYLQGLRNLEGELFTMEGMPALQSMVTP